MAKTRAQRKAEQACSARHAALHCSQHPAVQRRCERRREIVIHPAPDSFVIHVVNEHSRQAILPRQLAPSAFLHFNASARMRAANSSGLDVKRLSPWDCVIFRVSSSESASRRCLLSASRIARGVPAKRVLLRHAWPASLRPICGVYGLAIGALLSGSFIVEFVTAWPGLGRLTFEALRARDVYLVAACAATGAAFLALGTMTGDLLLAAADPRARQESAG